VETPYESFWLSLLQVEGTVLGEIWFRVFIVVLVSVVINVCDVFNIIKFPEVSFAMHTLLLGPLGLLLGFRTSVAYDRFWVRLRILHFAGVLIHVLLFLLEYFCTCGLGKGLPGRPQILAVHRRPRDALVSFHSKI
jgi:hypothetical protein